MKSVSIADYVGAGAECGDSGISLAGLEPSDTARVARTLTGGVTNRPPACQPAAFLFGDDSRARDPDKYTWLAPDAPRVIRNTPVTILRFSVMVGSALTVLGLEAWGGYALCKWLARVFA